MIRDDASLIRVARRDFEKGSKFKGIVARASAFAPHHTGMDPGQAGNDFDTMRPFLENGCRIGREYAAFRAYTSVGRPFDRWRR